MNTDEREFLWEKSARERRKEAGKEYLVFDAVVVYLRRVAGKSYLVLKPTVRIESPTGEEVSEDAERNLKMSILGWQHNNKFNEALESWRTRLFTDENFDFPPNCGSPFKFIVKRAPALAKIMSADRNRQIQVRSKFQPIITHAGVELREPDLVFSNRTGTATVSDPHPVRGIVQNRPFDYALTARNLAPPIQLAVICPARESRKLSEYLQRRFRSSSTNVGFASRRPAQADPG